MQWHGKHGVLHHKMYLIYSVRIQFSNAKIVFNCIQVWRDISYRSLLDFNSHLELMCFNLMSTLLTQFVVLAEIIFLGIVFISADEVLLD